MHGRLWLSPYVPRTRGDEPLTKDRANEKWMFPAHAGMNRLSTQAEAIYEMFPAHAGMNRFHATDWERLRQAMFPAHAGMNRPDDVPRTRGDEPKFEIATPD